MKFTFAKYFYYYIVMMTVVFKPRDGGGSASVGHTDGVCAVSRNTFAFEPPKLPLLVIPSM